VSSVADVHHNNRTGIEQSFFGFLLYIFLINILLQQNTTSKISAKALLFLAGNRYLKYSGTTNAFSKLRFYNILIIIYIAICPLGELLGGTPFGGVFLPSWVNELLILSYEKEAAFGQPLSFFSTG
jgi:hypothetical protein